MVKRLSDWQLVAARWSGTALPEPLTGDDPMYARITTFQVESSRLDELPAKIAKLSHLIKALPGMVDARAAWRADGQGAGYACSGDGAGLQCPAAA